MKNKLSLLLVVTLLTFSAGSFAAISGPSGMCIGSTHAFMADTSALGGTITTGTWSSSDPTVATIGATTGIVTAIATGTTLISFTTSTTVYTHLLTVSTAPAATVGGTTPICPGTSITLTNSVSGGTWSSGSSFIATVGATTGVVTGVNGGVVNIYYNMGTGCHAIKVVTVVAAPRIDSASGPGEVCVGAAGTFATAVSGGVWSSSDPSVATIGSTTGIVTGVSTGTAAISYGVTGACGLTGYYTRTITVTSTTTVATISGSPAVMVGFTTSLFSSIWGGTWSSGNPSVATVSSTGVVTGVSTGTATISYETTGCSGPAYGTMVVTVSAADCISGDVLFTSGPGTFRSVKVWLIKYNPSSLMLTAVDSTIVSATGTSAPYYFCGMGADSFRVKASIADTSLWGSPTGTTDYLPTYHSSSAYWSSASVINHAAGTHDVNKDIVMRYGTVTSGPGFVAGNVTMGANKGTSGAIPAKGLLIFCVNVTTGDILQHAYTDASGSYSFSNLPTGVPLKIYPELINYATTPYPPITLASGSTSMTAANFVQHTLSHTITPIVVAASTVTATSNNISLFPNPTSGMLNVKWNIANADNATVTVADVTGRQVLTENIDMTVTSENVQLDLSALNAGLYLVNIKADGVNYNGKIEVK